MTRTLPPDARSLVDVLRWRAVRDTGRTAYVFLDDAEVEEERVAWDEVDRRARAIAAELQALDAVGERALILHRQSVDYVTSFLGCLYAGVIAVPAFPARGGRALGRLERIVAHAGARFALADEEPAADEATAVGALLALRFLVPRALAADACDAWREWRPDADSIAFLQYTSGSTRAPRGVVVTHANLMANELAIRTACEHDADSTFVGWLPLFHDMGMVANALQPLYVGSLSVLMSPAAFLQRPVRWLRAISRYRAHTSGGPNFAYALCVDRVVPEERDGLDLSSWKIAFNGAEPIRNETLERFSTAYADQGFRRDAWYPCYGLAETTLLATGAGKARGAVVFAADADALAEGHAKLAASTESERLLVSSGRPWLDQEIVVVDPLSGQGCSPGRVGEIWLAGPSVARGYWSEPEESERVFGARLAAAGSRRFLRTGDLGFLDDGELFVTGRIDDMIVVRGHNHYPHDIEWTAEEAHPAVRAACTAAFTLEGAGEDRLAIVFELAAGMEPDPETLGRAVSGAVAEQHGLAVAVLAVARAGGVPKTTSGKVRRSACRDALLANALPLVWLRVQPEQVRSLPDRAAILSRPSAERRQAVLEALLPFAAARATTLPEWVDVDAPVERLGLDSAAALELVHRAEEAWGVVLGSAAFLADTSLAALAARVVAGLEGPPAAPIATATDGAGGVLLASAQLGLWVEQETAPESAAYNLARAFTVRGELDVDGFRSAFDRLLERHPALRTAFEVRDGIPTQRLGAYPVRLLSLEDVGTIAPREVEGRLRAEAERPFDLRREPPFRAVLLRRSEREHVLLLVAHHIVADFWSFVVLLRDLAVLYEAQRSGNEPELPPLRRSYGDFVRWHNALVAGPEGERLWRYWRERLGEGVPALGLPADRPRPPLRSLRGRAQTFRLGRDLTDALASLARAHGTTLHAVLLAAFQLLQARTTSQREVAFGIVVAGRPRADFAPLVGCFVNTVVVRGVLEPKDNFVSLLGRMSSISLEAIEHGDYPFSRLVERLRPPREPGRPPLVESLLVFHKEYGADGEAFRCAALQAEGMMRLGDLTLEVVPLPQTTAQTDLTLALAEIRGELVGFWEYSTDLFDAPTIERVAARFERLLRAIAADPEQPLAAVPLLDSEERECVLATWNDTDRTYDLEQCLHELVGSQARLRPDAVAVVADGDGDAQLSYAALDRHGELLARRLRALGVGAESRVAVLLRRSPQLPIALLGILRAGAAYVPLDVEDPRDRLAAIVEDAGVAAVVTDDELRSRVLSAAPIVTVDTPLVNGVGDPGPSSSAGPAVPQSPAYVLYTSGSTGRPKGVAVPHRGVCNRIRWMEEAYGLGPAERIFHKTPTTFDVSVWELFAPLVSGGCLVLAKPGGHRDPAYLLDAVARQQITTMHFIPSLLWSFLEQRGLESLVSLRRVICSGEVLPPALVDRFLDGVAAELHNLYGPTEASIDVAAWRCRRGDPATPIGRPIANTRLYVLDDALELLPPGAAGELSIGGFGLARGYVGRPDLTAEGFVPDPFAATPGARLYRTGDRACFRSDGTLLFLGRLDDQVKVRGQRVELGEVEAALRSHPQVGDVAVVMVGEGRDAALAAYVVPRGNKPDPADVRAFLAERLPMTMLPRAVVALDALPRTRSGKLDRNALPAPERVPRGISQAPATPTERVLAQIWSDELAVADPGVDEDFFALGGDSMRALRVIGLARGRGLALDLPDVLRLPTIRGLSAAAERRCDGRLFEPTARFALLAEADAKALPAHVVDAYPISRVQRALLFHSAHTPSYEVYVTSLHVRTPFDLGPMRNALERLFARHPYLRSGFDLASYSEPLQLVFRHVAAPFDVVDLRRLPDAERDYQFEAWLRRERKRRFDLRRGPLVRFTIHRRSDDSFRLSLTSFSLDGWATATLLTELFRDYSALRGGTRAAIASPAASYADFMRLEQEAVGAEDQRAAWARELEGMEPCPLPRWPRRKAVAADVLQQRSTFAVEPEVTAALRRVAQAVGVPLKSVLLAAHLRVVGVASGKSEVVTGLETNGRPERPDGDRVVGVFNNIVPLRLTVDRGTWTDLVRRAHAAERRLAPLRRYPLPLIERETGVRPLFETLFVFTHFHLYRELEALPELEVLDAVAPDQTYVPLTAHFNIDARSERLRLFLDYDPRELASQQVDWIGGYYLRALRALASRPYAMHAWDSLLDVDERRRLGAWGSAPGTFPRLVPELVAEQAARTPAAVAVASTSATLSYGMLNAQVEGVARALRADHLGPDDVVAVYARRSPEFVVALLGVLRAGAAFLPLDPLDPPERLAWLVADSGAALVLADPSLGAPSWAGRARVARLGRTQPARGRDAWAAPHPEALAYVLYTSGSSGTPKGVAVPQRALANYVAWAASAYDAAGRVPVHTSVAFDFTLTSLLTPLVMGGTVRLTTEEEGVAAVAHLLASEPTSLLKVTPSHLTGLNAMLAASGVLPDVGTLVVGGESLHAEALATWGANGAARRIINEYGPTETTVGCTAYAVPSSPRAGSVPIGRPIANMRLRVLAGGTEAPIGVAGELHVGGLGVARGYVGLPGQTAERFVPDPTNPEPGARLYATGDLACYDVDGTLQYLGRSDRQVKLRGYRIELDEIERVLVESSAVQDVAVVVAPGTRPRLVAYVVRRDGSPAVAELRDRLRARLPGYMVPSEFVEVDALPLTRNGKVAYEKLAEVPRPSSSLEALLERVEALSDEEARVRLAQAAEREEAWP